MRDAAGTDPGPEEVQLRVVLSDVAAEVVCCALAGDIDLASGPQLESRLAEATATAPKHLVIDLSEVEFLGSIGLKILVDADARQRRAGRRLAVVVSGNHAAHRPLQATGLDQVLDLHDSREAAVAACRAAATEQPTP